jgi:hypothetical protein
LPKKKVLLDLYQNEIDRAVLFEAYSCPAVQEMLRILCDTVVHLLLLSDEI